MTWLWIFIGAIALLSLFSGGSHQNNNISGKAVAHWIYHPHVIDDDDYECSKCHARFRKESPSCPKCGTMIKGKTEKDEDEWIDEEEELDMIFEDE